MYKDNRKNTQILRRYYTLYLLNELQQITPGNSKNDLIIIFSHLTSLIYHFLFYIRIILSIWFFKTPLLESSSTGPFTLFAPTDKGFDALPADVLDKLSKDKALLKKVLSYHVVSGKILAKDLKNNELLDSLDNPEKLRINIYGQVSFSLSNIYLDLRIQTMPWVCFLCCCCCCCCDYG